MTRDDEVLLWINDRLGRKVEIRLYVQATSGGGSVLATRGILSHHTELGRVPTAEEGDEMSGCYVVGEGDACTILDLGRIAGFEEVVLNDNEPDEIRFYLDHHVVDPDRPGWHDGARWLSVRVMDDE